MSYRNPALSNNFQVCLAGNLAATTNGRAIDTRGWNSACFFYKFGTTTTFSATPTFDLKLQDSPTTTTYTDITSAAITQVTTTQNDKSICIRLKSLKGLARYIRAVITISGTVATGATGAADNAGVLVLGDPDTTRATTAYDTFVTA